MRLTWPLLLLTGLLACGGRSEKTVDGNAAGTSVGTDAVTCADQRSTYAAFRQETIVNQSTNGCMSDTECGIFEDLTDCSPACGFVIPNAARRGIDDRLYAGAAMICTLDCPPAPIPPCGPLALPRCVAGTCR